MGKTREEILQEMYNQANQAMTETANNGQIYMNEIAMPIVKDIKVNPDSLK